MKYVKIFILLLIIFFSPVVFAYQDEWGNYYNGSTIKISYTDYGGLKVYDGTTQLSNYDEYVEFSDGVFLLKKNIDRFEINYKDFTIITNNNLISINDLIASGQKTGNIINSHLKIERSSLKTGEHQYRPTTDLDNYTLNIVDSTIESNDRNTVLDAKVYNVKNSTLSLYKISGKGVVENSFLDFKSSDGRVLLDNSTMNIDYMHGTYYLYNMSTLNAATGGDVSHFILDNSKFSMKYKEGLDKYESLEINGRFEIHNSLFEVDYSAYPETGRYFNPLIFDNNNYEFDDNMMFVDSEGNNLKKITIEHPPSECITSRYEDIFDNDFTMPGCGDEVTTAEYVLQNGEPARTLSITSIVEVRLKVNGTWADGTTDDIVLYKPAFSQISYTDIPVGKMTLEDFENGDWDTKPVNAVLEENTNVVLTLTISNNKQGEVKGVDENPKTGVFNDVLLFIPVIIFIIGFNYLKKFELFKKM